jgi:hypothetical protein
MRVFASLCTALLMVTGTWAQEPPPQAEGAVTSLQEQSPQPAPQQEAEQSPQQQSPQVPPPAPKYPDQDEPPPAEQPRSAPDQKHTITIPAGTHLALVLTSPVGTAVSQVGDPLRAVIDFPVSIDNALAIPAGTFVEGKIAAVVRSHRKGLEMRFSKLIFANGYSVPLSDAVLSAAVTQPPMNPAAGPFAVAGTAAVSEAGKVGDVFPLSAELSNQLSSQLSNELSSEPGAASATSEALAANEVPELGKFGSAQTASEKQNPRLTTISYAMFGEPQQPPTPPTPPPLPHVGPSRGLVIGVGLAALGGVLVATILLTRHQQAQRDIYFEAGWKFDLILQTPLIVDADSVAAAAAVPNR